MLHMTQETNTTIRSAIIGGKLGPSEGLGVFTIGKYIQSAAAGYRLPPMSHRKNAGYIADSQGQSVSRSRSKEIKRCCFSRGPTLASVP